ncbi:amidohydrolase family protein [Nannocystis pusilla]|uniref:amidohydrolase family protein n=1 Tax=Nannocystis pusilla TaxID=889268 RepID=UPI003B7E6039
MGARRRRLVGVPVRRAAHADPRRAQRRRARHPGVRAPPLLAGAAQPRRAAGRRLHARHPDPPGGVIQRDRHGEPTGLLVAKPNAWILYATLAKGPRLGLDEQRNSTRHFMRELNRLGITGAIDAGGGFQQYPEHYQIIEELAAARQLTVRVAYNLFTQRPGQELDDFRQWSQAVSPGRGDDYYRLNGAGEMLVYSAADFEDFLEPRPDLPPQMEAQLEAVVEHLVAHRWPFRLHATYDESITRMLDVFEAVNKKVPFAGLRWFFDHAETVSAKNIDRIAALGGGIAIQHRMAYQGEHFLHRYGPEATSDAPPVRRMLAAGIPVGGGTDATRVASYNPWVGLGWLVSGRSVGGTELLGPGARLSREQALRLYTAGNGWFSGEDGQRGLVAEGCLGDLAVLSDDYFAVPEAEIRNLTSVLTVVGGDVVHGSGDFGGLAPPPLPFSPDWAPPAQYGGYDPGVVARALRHRAHHHHHHHVGLACPCAVF